MKDIKELKELFGERCFENFPLRQYNTFHTGGNADIAIFPQTDLEVADSLRILRAEQIPFCIIGNGSNLLISDEGVEGVVIILSGLKGIITEGTELHVKSGSLLREIAYESMRQSLTGFEFASGIPGSVGGAIVMNAGAYGSEMKDVIIRVKVLDCIGNIRTRENYECEFSYRESAYQTNGDTILSAVIELRQGDEELIRERMNALNEQRRLKQPLDYPSAGSTFKRPKGFFAAKLIEDSGLKGCRVGGAMVSEKHAGFIINYDNATSRDVSNLIDIVRETVFRKFGVELSAEVKLIGRNYSER